MPKGQSEAQVTREGLEIEVQSLKRQNEIHRISMSAAITLLTQYVTERMPEDHIVTPDFPRDKKSNPWIEQKKCSIV